MRAIFLDRDGVLNRKSTQARYVRRWSEFEWMPGALEAVGLLTKNGIQTVLITNQAGVGRGQVDIADLDEIHENMRRELKAVGGRLDHIYMCTHRVEDNCACRKPKPGMLLQAATDLKLDLAVTPFIGDDPKDLAAGRAAGCPTFLLENGTRLLDVVKNKILCPR